MRESLIPPGMTSVLYSLTDRGLPDIPVIGINNMATATSPLVEHCHPGIMEIRYLKSGQITWHVGGIDYVQRGNEFFITYPGEMHRTSGHPFCRGELYWLQVQFPPPGGPLLGLLPERAAPIVQGLLDIPRRVFPGKKMAIPLFEKIIRLHNADVGNPDLLALAMSTRLQAWLLLVIECAHGGDEDLRPTDLQSKLEELIEWIREHPGEKHHIPDLADRLGVSPSRFFQKFKESVGMTPGEFILRGKVDAARVLLIDTDKPITEIAYELGFSSSQYFATVFKRYTSRTPRQIRRG